MTWWIVLIPMLISFWIIVKSKMEELNDVKTLYTDLFRKRIKQLQVY